MSSRGRLEEVLPSRRSSARAAQEEGCKGLRVSSGRCRTAGGGWGVAMRGQRGAGGQLRQK
eukprot:2737071-Rhodomonas_salina.1